MQTGTARLAGLAVIAVLVAGCAASRSTSSSDAPATRLPSAPSSTGSGMRVAGDGDNGRTVSLPVGAELAVTLAGTYWRFDAPSNPAPVAVEQLNVAGRPPAGHACVPGQGCGTVSARCAR